MRRLAQTCEDGSWWNGNSCQQVRNFFESALYIHHYEKFTAFVYRGLSNIRIHTRFISCCSVFKAAQHALGGIHIAHHGNTFD